ncbi:hypothetical protein GCM10023149_41280 [Mucilaginibacter gynuensis]|uniref:Uncharacterized protein n=1 Tax=Mucilaginibacter gynuensis TaxID=1302236 RepID=A0ABP8H490_9SPHI
MLTKNSMIFRDCLYALLVAIILWPTSDLKMELWMKIVVVVIAVAQRIWQHVNYYKLTGKIY